MLCLFFLLVHNKQTRARFKGGTGETSIFRQRMRDESLNKYDKYVLASMAIEPGNNHASQYLFIVFILFILKAPLTFSDLLM